MARAKRHFIPGYIWHITHRCHKREFLLKFSKDRHWYLQWLYQARKRYGLTILNYMVTSNHVHLLVVDDGQRNVIPDSMQLVAGRTGQGVEGPCCKLQGIFDSGLSKHFPMPLIRLGGPSIDVADEMQEDSLA